jgi:DNA-binding winged helix-turn-helix (wHTH) protein
VKQFGSFVLDLANQCLRREGSLIALQPKPFAVLRYLVENPGRLITHDELLDKLWPETFVQPQVLRTYMLELRKILGDDASQPQYIQTLPKRGYCFVAAVSEASDPHKNSESIKTSEPIRPCLPPPQAIIGREQELALLRAELASVAAGQRRTVFLCGEAGLGKSALLDFFLGNDAASLAVARGHCVPGAGGDEDFYPILEALGALCSSSTGEAACRVLARVAPAWLSLMGRADLCPASVPPQERRPGALCSALEEIASATPLLLVLEDLQWADAATLNLIAALARRRAPAQLMIVASYRPRSVSAQHPLKSLRHDLLMQQLCTELALAPLPKAAILALLRRELECPLLPEGLGNFVHERAEGNPLFAALLLRHLLAQHLLVRRTANDDASWQLAPDFEHTAGVPEELAQMIELEIERLTDPEQRLLEAASLMPVAFPAWAVAAALEQDPLETEEACEALARKVCFVQHAGEDELPDGSLSGFYVFTHGIFREVLYQRQAASRRARRHIRIAERLGTLFPGREAHVAREMAMHYEAAASWERGAEALRTAARYALQRHSDAEATELLERAEHLAARCAALTAATAQK